LNFPLLGVFCSVGVTVSFFRNKFTIIVALCVIVLDNEGLVVVVYDVTVDVFLFCFGGMFDCVIRWEC